MTSTTKLLTVGLILTALGWSAGTAAAFPPGQGPGGPILVVTDPSDPVGRYYAEILTAEGLNAFDVRGIGEVSDATLSGYAVVILAPTAVSASQATALAAWVNGGGNLIAMRPGPALAPLLGLGSDTGDLDDGYVRVNAAAAPGAGITGDTMQYHGRADLWTLAGATTVADLYAGATMPTPNPAVTLHGVGAAGGQAAAFSYDLARSVAQTRQGNPAWVGQKRDGTGGPIRSDDLFFPDWANLDKVAIPQADEQQRLLANLVTQMSADRVPMPRFWYFPRGERAVVVMTGDDHTAPGTVAHLDRFLALSPPGCSVPEWGCVRSTSYVYPINGMSGAQVAAYQGQGFEIALHLDNGCANFTAVSLRADWAAQLPAFTGHWPGVVEAPRTNRTHCIPWSDWATQAKVEREFGIRLDTNYYWWPASWVQNRPGVFTGSGIPMRFADVDGSPIDVYQAATQLTDESGIDIPAHIAALLDGALGPQGYYGAFTTNMHTDRDLAGAEAIVAAAQARGVPVISAEQLLDWVDGRNDSSFGGLAFDGSHLRFTVHQAPGAHGLEAMLPAAAAAGALSGLTRNGVPISPEPRAVKGIDYRVFAAAPGDYVATYGPGGAARGRGASRTARDLRAPRVRVRPRRVRASRRGLVKLKVSCPRGERICRVALRLRHKGTTVASTKVRVAGGKTRRVSLRLTRSARRLLRRSGSLRVTAVAAARDLAANQATTRTRIRVLAPRRPNRR
jgi:hypothetical protein